MKNIIDSFNRNKATRESASLLYRLPPPICLALWLLSGLFLIFTGNLNILYLGLKILLTCLISLIAFSVVATMFTGLAIQLLTMLTIAEFMQKLIGGFVNLLFIASIFAIPALTIQYFIAGSPEYLLGIEFPSNALHRFAESSFIATSCSAVFLHIYYIGLPDDIVNYEWNYISTSNILNLIFIVIFWNITYYDPHKVLIMSLFYGFFCGYLINKERSK